MSLGKTILSVIVAIIVAFGIGYVWGSSGRSPIEQALNQSRQQLDLADVRGHLLDARVSFAARTGPVIPDRSNRR